MSRKILAILVVVVLGVLFRPAPAPAQDGLVTRAEVPLAKDDTSKVGPQCDWSSSLGRHEFSHSDRFPSLIFPAVILSFLFLTIIARIFFTERSEQRRIELIRSMVEKGQAIPQDLMQELLMPRWQRRAACHAEKWQKPRDFLKKAIALLFISGGFITIYLLGEAPYKALLIVGIVLGGLGIGNLVALATRREA